MLGLSLPANLKIEVREFLKLAVPLASAQLAQSATGFADTIMMGRMGPDALAAGGLASIILLSVMLGATGVVMGISPLVAEAFGAGQKTRIQHLVRQGLWLSIMVALPMMIVMSLSNHWLLWVGQAEATVQPAYTYLNIILWGLFPIVGFAAFRATVSALSHARPVMTIMVTGTAFNIAGNYVLGFGKLGFPQMGLAGLALASVIAQWGMFIAMVLYVLKHPKLREYRFFQELHRLRPRILWQLIWIGVPIGIFSGLEAAFFMVIMFWVGTFGTIALAAHQIVLQTLTIVFMVPLGISFATTARVGQWLGRKDLQGVQRATWVSIGLSTVFAGSMSVMFLLFPKQVIGIYLDVQNPENFAVVSLATTLLVIAAIAQVLDAFQKAIYGSLQGLQDTQVPMVLIALGYWVFGLSVACALGSYFNLGTQGLWIGQSVAIALVAGLFTWRLYKLVVQRKHC